MRPSFSIGIEEEYQTVDPVTRDLRSHIQTEMLAQGKMRLQERVKAEMHTSVVEVGTQVCTNIEQARDDIYELRRQMIKLAREHNLVLVAGATHPFADWRTQEIYPDPRYHQVVKDLQLVARANLIFGLHVHVGVEDREEAMRIMNSMRYFLPHIMALATNSPFWLGLNTGYKGYRAKVFENFPRTGIPDAFASYSEFENYVSLLVKTNCIDNAKKIWWDIRPHPFFNTVEVRACDIPLRAEETVAIAALIQAPGRREPGDAAADDHDRHLDGLFRCRECSAIAQLVADLVAVVDEAAGDGAVGFGPEPDQRRTEELAAAAAQCVISRQSRS